jgi:hypothetical protein
LLLGTFDNIEYLPSHSPHAWTNARPRVWIVGEPTS